MSKSALVVRGGWDGHQPEETTDLMIPFLESRGYRVRVEEHSDIYSDVDLLSRVDLIVQCNTMTTISDGALAGLIGAVVSGVGFAGWHGGIADSYRESADYLQLVGGQFAHHAPKPPEDRIGDQSDNYLTYTVNIVPEMAEHPIVAGLGDFELTTEQYWVLSDSYNDVLATTTCAARSFDPWSRPVISPAVWTRNWGRGRVFVCTAGHRLDILSMQPVRTIVERGLLWASR